MPEETDQVPVYDRESLPVECEVPGGATWAEFELVEPLRAIRIEGPFGVRLPLEHALRDSLGVMQMPLGGWVAIDLEGDPFPITTEHMGAIYRPATADPISNEQLGEMVRERFGAWLDLEDIRLLLNFIAGDVDGAGLEELGTIAKLQAIAKGTAG